MLIRIISAANTLQFQEIPLIFLFTFLPPFLQIPGGTRKMLFSKESKFTHALWGRTGVRYHST